jgi:hypothetical protein
MRASTFAYGVAIMPDDNRSTALQIARFLGIDSEVG